MIKVYQARKAHNEALAERIELRQDGSTAYQPARHRDLFTHVATVRSDDPESVFAMMNRPGWRDDLGNFHYLELRRVHSLSVGDVLVTEAGQALMVDPVGFSEVHFQEPAPDTRPGMHWPAELVQAVPSHAIGFAP